jgi:hypothetical protein
MTIRQYLEEEGETWTLEMQATFSDMKVTRNEELEVTMRIREMLIWNEELQEYIETQVETWGSSGETTKTFSGGNIGTAWSIIKANYSNAWDTVNDSKHSIKSRWDGQVNEFTTGILNGLQISQNGKKIKVPAGLFGSEIPAIIMTKQ